MCDGQIRGKLIEEARQFIDERYEADDRSSLYNACGLIADFTLARTMCCEERKKYYTVRRVENDKYEYLCESSSFFSINRFWASDPDALKCTFVSRDRAEEVAFALSKSVQAEFEIIPNTYSS